MYKVYFLIKFLAKGTFKSLLPYLMEKLHVAKRHTMHETSAGTIAEHGDPIDGFAPGQPWAYAGP